MSRSTRGRFNGLSRMNGASSMSISISNHTQNFQEVSRVLISIDGGTAYMKACWKVFFKNDNPSPRLCQDNMIVGLRQVRWPNQETLVRTQLAYEWSEDGEESSFRQLWGNEVTLALRDGRIGPDQVFRWMKPILYADDSLSHDDQERLDDQIDRLPQFIKYSRSDDINPGEIRKLTCLDLYSDALGHAYRYVLKCVKQEVPTIPWPHYDSASQYRGFDPTEITPIETVLPVPASSTPEHVRLALTAAKRAGIPEPYPVAEPAAACAFDVQSSFETSGRPMEPECKMVVDIGCGTVDLQVWSITGIDPFKLHEEVKGDANWVGGRFVNQTCKEYVKSLYTSSMDTILKSLSEGENSKSQAEFLDTVAEEFEVGKRNFNGFDRDGQGEVVLSIKGLPEIASSSKLKAGALVLSKKDMTEIFSKSFNAIAATINSIIQDFHTQNTVGNELRKNIKQILLVGGGSASPHIRELMRRTYETGSDPAAGYTISVKTPDSISSGSATSIALGALLMLIDKPFMGDRILRRGYCVAWDQEVDSTCIYPPSRARRDPHDGVLRVTEVSKFLFPKGRRVGYHDEARSRGGWRGLFLDEERPQGWIITETIFYSDVTSEDGVWVNDEDGSIYEAGDLKFPLSADDCKDFEIRKTPDGRREYKYLEYEVALILSGIVMTFSITIPRSGLFTDDGDGHGENPIRRTGHFDCGGVFQLFNAA